MRLGATILSAVVYCLVIIIVMYINTAYLDRGNPTIGADGWTVYWYVWAGLYSPLFLFGLVLNWLKNDTLKEYVKCNFVLILLLSFAIEISFILDVPRSILFIEYIILAITWVYVLKLKMYLIKHFT